MLHGDMAAYEPLIRERRANRDALNHGDFVPASPGAMLFPELVGIDWIAPSDGSSAVEHTRRLVSAIGAAMVGPTDAAAAIGPIPSAFTYFGQFVFHDMVFSRVFGLPEGHHLKNAVSEGLDLSGLYGRGPQVDGHLYEAPTTGAACRFPTGLACTKNFQGKRSPTTTGRDVPRLDMSGRFLNVAGRRAAYRPLVADPRNDDNLILSQLMATLLGIHNRLVDVQLRSGVFKPSQAYARARSYLITAYRRIVVHDYMRRLLDPPIWSYFFQGNGDQGRGTAALQDLSGLPLEFTFGASRFAHAMVRQFYTVNDSFAEQAGPLDKLLSFSSMRPEGDVPVEASWMVDWRRFAAGQGDASIVQHARRISPFMASELATAKLAADLEERPQPVAFMDIWRCYELTLPSGQDVARAILGKLADEVSFPVLEGDAMLPTAACTARFRFHAEKLRAAIEAAGTFKTATPLSYYVLQEASQLGDDGSRLGPVGSYIVAATVAASLHRTANTNFFGASAPENIDPNTLAGFLALGDVASTPDRDLQRKLDKFIEFTGGA